MFKLLLISINYFLFPYQFIQFIYQINFILFVPIIFKLLVSF